MTDLTTYTVWFLRYEATLAGAQAKRTVSDALLAELHDLQRHIRALLDIGPVGTLAHYDSWTGNLMVSLKGEYTRVTDYLDLMGYCGDYARALSSLFGPADQRLMQVYGQRHGFDETFEARFGLYSLKMCLQLVNMYPGNPDHLAGTCRRLQAVQEYFGNKREH